MGMIVQQPSTADLLGRALLAATLAVAEDAEAARGALRARSRCGLQAAASALAQCMAWPVSRAARLLGLPAEQVWDARRDRPPGFEAAEREAAAAIRQALGSLARPSEADPDDADEPDDDGEVIRLRAISPAILRWSRAYVRLGVPVDDLAMLFSVAPDVLALAIEAGQ
jgi:hypothetical protein